MRDLVECGEKEHQSDFSTQALFLIMKSPAAFAVVCFLVLFSTSTAWKRPAPLTDRVIGGGDDSFLHLQMTPNHDDPFRTHNKWVCNTGYDLVDRGDDICCYKYASYEGRCCTKRDALNCFHVGHISHHIH